MKILLVSLLGLALAILLCYLAWSFYWLIFDISKWSSVGRGTFLIIGGGIGIFSMTAFASYFFITEIDNDNSDKF